MRITFQSALQLTLPSVAELQTATYGGGWKSNPTKLADIFRVHNVDLEHSLIAYDGRKLMGLALLGRRRAHGWLYDFGILPAYRGKGLGTRLLMTAAREAAKAGVRSIELDVWEKRDDAIRLYQRVGFQHVRTYLNVEASGDDLRLSELDLPPRLRLAVGRVEDVIGWYAAARDEPEPCWDRGLPSLLTYGDAQLCTVADDQGLVACMHYVARSASGADPNRVRPMFIGLTERSGLEHIRALFSFAARSAFENISTTMFRVALEPEPSKPARLLLDVGMQIAGRALDMRLNIAQLYGS
ncbi:MAG TPA: GNAT family N-acetyltransferase [Herpetosiphonaceae bacterium]